MNPLFGRLHVNASTADKASPFLALLGCSSPIESLGGSWSHPLRVALWTRVRSPTVREGNIALAHARASDTSVHGVADSLRILIDSRALALLSLGISGDSLTVTRDWKRFGCGC